MIILFLGEHSNGDMVFIIVEYPTSLAAIQRSVSITPIQCLPAISQFELAVLLEYIDLLLYMYSFNEQMCFYGRSIKNIIECMAQF